jgi:hypothetical protein
MSVNSFSKVNHMKKIVLRTSGFGLFLFLFLDLLFIFPLVYFRDQLFSFQKASIGDIIGLLFMILFVAYITLYIFANKIRLTNECLIIRHLNYGLPKIITRHIDLHNVKSMYIGSKKFASGFLKDNKSWKTESKKFYNQFISHRYPGAADVSRFASGFMDILVILMKDDKVTIVNTKPFSAAGFRKLIIELRKNDVDVFVGNKSLEKHSD